MPRCTSRGPARTHGNATRTGRSPTRIHLAWSRVPSVVGLLTFVGLAIVIAVIYGLYWVLKQVKAWPPTGETAPRLAAPPGAGLYAVCGAGAGT